MVATIQQDAKHIGITFTVRTINGAYPTVQTVAKNVPSVRSQAKRSPSTVDIVSAIPATSNTGRFHLVTGGGSPAVM